MSRGKRNYRRIKPEQEQANRKVVAPPSASFRDKLCYHAIDALARLQVFILERCVEEHVWRSTTGKVERIRDLHDSHLENIVHMIDRDGYVIEKHLRDAILSERFNRLEGRRNKWQNPKTNPPRS